ncbi:MAG: DUF1294 domain-containing protein [Clostridia bacterium]|nr:DUF1294 domain-containing protein [Clostridia bacterium]MBO5671456.1 DUF1294 domain-containing protein [Clostridia bacterium]
MKFWQFPALLLLLMSLITFCLYGIDKYKAKRGAWRISEKALLLCALFFGGIGAFLGMRLFRHKTRHWYFRILVPLFAILQIALAAIVVIVHYTS